MKSYHRWSIRVFTTLLSLTVVGPVSADDKQRSIKGPQKSIDNRFTVTDFVDIIELNHCLDFQGNVAFRQLIFYQWSAYDQRFQIRDTLLLQDQKIRPKRNGISGRTAVRWIDGTRIRSVQCTTFRTTRTATDPEERERIHRPTRYRKMLSQNEPPFQPDDRGPEKQVAVRLEPTPLLKR